MITLSFTVIAGYFSFTCLLAIGVHARGKYIGYMEGKADGVRLGKLWGRSDACVALYSLNYDEAADALAEGDASYD